MPIHFGKRNTHNLPESSQSDPICTRASAGKQTTGTARTCPSLGAKQVNYLMVSGVDPNTYIPTDIHPFLYTQSGLLKGVATWTRIAVLERDFKSVTMRAFSGVGCPLPVARHGV